MFLARTFHEVVYCECDPLFCAVVEHNLKVSGGITKVEVKNGESISLLVEYPDNSLTGFWLILHVVRGASLLWRRQVWMLSWGEWLGRR